MLTTEDKIKIVLNRIDSISFEIPKLMEEINNGTLEKDGKSTYLILQDKIAIKTALEQQYLALTNLS
mgnify:FL=1